MAKSVEIKDLSLEALALYLNGEQEIGAFSAAEQAILSQIEDGSELVFENREYALPKTLCINRPLTLTGNGAHLVGNGVVYGILVTSSNVTVSNFKMNKIPFLLEIDPYGTVCEHIVIDRIDAEIVDSGIQAASSRSNGVMRDIHIQHCQFVGSDSWEETGLSANLPISVYAAAGRNDGTKEINNCLVEDVHIVDNRFNGSYRSVINVTTAMAAEFRLTEYTGTYSGNTVRNLHILRNHAECCWDGPYNITGEFMNASHSLIDGLEIAENYGGFGIVGIYLFSGESVWNNSDGCVVRNIVIRDNHLKRVIADVGEPSRGMFITAGRIDYYENMSIRNSLLENLDIYGNTIDGAGIVVCGAYAMVDGDALMENNVVSNIRIHDNSILNAEQAFCFAGAQMEGRRYDWNFGYPRHDKKWLEALESDDCVTMKMVNNRIEGLTCVRNKVDGYRYRVVASGTECRGHGEAKGNSVVKDIVFSDNTFGIGESHVRVADYLYDDFSCDGGGNAVDKVFLKR